MLYILVSIIISGVIAYLGDALGTVVGKKRLSLFGMRPRVTALFVAISTGIIITLSTFLIGMMLSEDVRLALFSIEKLKKDIDTLQAESSALENLKNKLEQEKTSLSEDVARLTTQVKLKETESVAFRKDEPLAVTVIKAGQEPKEVMKAITNLIITLSDHVRRRHVLVKPEIEFFTENKEQLGSMANHIASSTDDLVLGAIAAENIIAGEELGNVRFILLPNDLIFQKNQQIASMEIDGTLSRTEIAKIMQNFMDEINHEVVNVGMLANPLTGSFGNMSYGSMIAFYDMINKIKELNRKIILIAVVPEDTYAIGPLNVVFKFEETGENLFNTDPNSIKPEDKQTTDIASFSSEALVSNQDSTASDTVTKE
mgnify:CR=1 FL=1